MKKKKALIITWCNTRENYGQTLQAYALQRIVRKMGFNVQTILFDSSLKTGHSWLVYFIHKLREPNIHIMKKIKFFLFILNNMKITLPCHDIDDLNEINEQKKYDVFICGSDQIWGPNELDPVLFADVNNCTKKIAYAAGTTNLEDAEQWTLAFRKMQPYLQKFSAISMRELDGKEIISRYTDSPVKVVLDPTLLLSPREWEIVRNKKRKGKKENYLLCYFLGEDKNYNDFFHQITDHYHLTGIIKIYRTLDNTTGPDEWIDLIANAGAVITDSFHGTVFSIIYKKEFFSVKRVVPEIEWPKRKGECPYANPKRVTDLLSLLGIKERFVPEGGSINFDSRIDYMKVFEVWKRERSRSLKWLKKALD